MEDMRMEADVNILGLFYDMLFPYREYKYYLDESSVCIDINRKLKSFCKNTNEDKKYLVLAMAKMVGIKYDENTPLSVVCGKIQTYVMDSCLEGKYNTQLALHWGVGSAPHIPESTICKRVRNVYYTFDKYVMDSIFINYADPKKIPFDKRFLRQTIDSLIAVFDSKVNQDFSQNWSRGNPMLPKYSSWFKDLNLDQVEKLTEKDRDTFLNLLMDPREKDIKKMGIRLDVIEFSFLNNIVLKLKEKIIPIDITWKDLCLFLN